MHNQLGGISQALTFLVVNADGLVA